MNSMKNEAEKLPQRKHPRLDNYDYSSAGLYFITICSHNRKCIFSRPTVMDIICTFKSLTTRECKKAYPTDKVFQNSFYEHIIRNKEEYAEIMKYIHDNPAAWELDSLYSNN